MFVSYEQMSAEVLFTFYYDDDDTTWTWCGDVWGTVKVLLQVDKMHQSVCVLGLCLLFVQIHAHIEKQLYSNWIAYVQTHSVFAA